MKRINLLFVMIIISTSLFAQSKESRTTDAFTEVESCYGIFVYLVEGIPGNLDIEINGKIQFENVKTEVKNNRLYVGLKKIKGMPKKSKVVVTVAVGKLNAIHASSGSKIEGTFQLKSDDLKVTTNSGAYIFANIDVAKLKCDSNSGAMIIVKGQAPYSQFEVSSGACIKAKDLITTEASVSASSGADITCNVSELISLDASSGGRIRYKGGAQVKKVSTGSGGSVQSL